MTATITLPRGASLCHLPNPFPLARGGQLDAAVLAYERHGRRGGPAVVVLGGISAGRGVRAAAGQPTPGWWQQQVGDGLAIDTRCYDVLAFDWLGGRGASTRAGATALPFVDAADQARALWCLCDALGIDRLFTIVGCSYGGMVAQHAAAEAPQRVARLGIVAAAHRGHALASAWREVQRGIVELGRRTGHREPALALARALAMTTYRSGAALAARFPAPPEVVAGELRTAVGPWLAARGAAFARDFDAEAFLCLNRSIDAHHIDPAMVRVPTWLLAFASDLLVPAADVAAFASRLPQLAGHRCLNSPHGHDAFLLETTAVAAWLSEVLS
ncbi:MAG: homoserine O-succinyltransferase [Planctomycetes bacterium]|nr:homoserine O-succinyltransferase [Planctomycetota bacterium]